MTNKKSLEKFEKSLVNLVCSSSQAIIFNFPLEREGVINQGRRDIWWWRKRKKKWSCLKCTFSSQENPFLFATKLILCLSFSSLLVSPWQSFPVLVSIWIDFFSLFCLFVILRKPLKLRPFMTNLSFSLLVFFKSTHFSPILGPML